MSAGRVSTTSSPTPAAVSFAVPCPPSRARGASTASTWMALLIAFCRISVAPTGWLSRPIEKTLLRQLVRTREIYLFDYNAEDGSLSNQRDFARFNESDGLPDGATLDAEGRLWSAMWDGSCVVRLLPDGGIDERILLPTRKASSLTFGGNDYTDIYITTAGGNTREADGDLAGSLFRVRATRPGVPEFFSRILLPNSNPG